MELRPFEGNRGANQTVSPGAESASVTVNAVSKSVRLVNSGANICYVRIGASPQTASTADLPVRPTSEIIVSKGSSPIAASTLAMLGTPAPAVWVAKVSLPVKAFPPSTTGT